jgi:hypothetical protein
MILATRSSAKTFSFVGKQAGASIPTCSTEMTERSSLGQGRFIMQDFDEQDALSRLVLIDCFGRFTRFSSHAH